MSQSDSQEHDFEQLIEAVEQNLTELKARYNQVQTDSRTQTELTQRQKQLRQQQRQHRTTELQQELAQIQQQLENIELQLESQLISWNSFKQPFWQAVRFGGLGVVVGWILRACSA